MTRTPRVLPRLRGPAGAGRRLGAMALSALLAANVGVAALPIARAPDTVQAAGCKIYVAAGDDIPNGHDLGADDKRYPEKLLADRLKAPGWCLYNQAANGQTSSSFISGGGLSKAWNQQPDLLTIQLGEQNTPMVNAVTRCFDRIKAHDFTGGSSCAAQILGNTSLWTDLTNNLTTILQYTRVMASQRPGLVVAVVNYANPFPQATDASTKFPTLCQQVIDSWTSCLNRWAQLPPALSTIDQVFQKLNKTLKDAMAPFQAGLNGWRWVYVDIYTPFKGHEMKMDVTLRDDTVCHLCGTQATYMDTHVGERNIGTDKAWWVEGSTGTDYPDYLLTPGPIINPPVVIQAVSQSTQGMGVWPNQDGHACIATAIWEADTILPGTTPLKWLLGSGEAASTSICQ